MIVWDYYSKKKQRIAEAFPDILQQCETVLENLWLIMFALVETLKKEGKRLSPVQTFNLIFFQRNIAYLISAYKLAEQGRYDEAIEECTKAIELDSNLANAYANRALASGLLQ